MQCFGEATIIEVSNRTQKIFVKDQPPNLEETHHEIHELKRKKVETQKYIAKAKEKIKLLESEKSFLSIYGDRIRPSDQVMLLQSWPKQAMGHMTSVFMMFHEILEVKPCPFDPLFP